MTLGRKKQTMEVIKNAVPEKKETELNNESLLMAVLWHQTAAEYTALCYQTYNVAKDRITADKSLVEEEKRAVILDVDETVLQNHFYNASDVFYQQHYPTDFDRWIENGRPELVAGCLDFLLFADSLGYKIFYITNRSLRHLSPTINTLASLGVPQVDSTTVLVKSTESSKEKRRQSVADNHRITLLVGDNLIDFAEFFDTRILENRKEAVFKHSNEFGNTFLILPNIMSGDWIKALLQNQRNLSKEDRVKALSKYLKIQND